MSYSLSHKSRFSKMSQWWWMTLALIVFLIFGISTVLLQKELRKNQENRSQADVIANIPYITKGISNLTGGTDSYFELNLTTLGQPMDRFYLEFDVLVDAKYVNNTNGPTAQGIGLTNSNLKFLDVLVTPITAPNSAGQVGWHVRTGIASANFPAESFVLNVPTSTLRFTLTAPTAGPVIVVFDQARTNPYISPFPSPAQVSLPDIIFDVAQVACVYTYSDWTTCITPGQQQTRTATANSVTCPAENPANLTQTCPNQCAYAYSDWTACSNGWQTRTYSIIPTVCNWYQTGSLQPLAQQCQEVVSSQDFTTYTYEACWNEQSAGNSSYIIWDKIKFPSVTKVDVSTTSDFAGYANKDVTAASSTLNDNYLATDGINFRTVTDGKNNLWVFWPGYTYYFRLYYGINQHSGVISYYVPKCAGVGGVSYKQCNETCSANKDCASNLSCVSGQCRRADNSSSNICAALPDQGLNRACNEYCADTKECSNGYTCWWNRCRLPQNVESTSCRVALRTVPPAGSYYRTKGDSDYIIPGYSDSAPANITPEMSCNEACRTNRDCAANLRCYLGACRLSENISNLSCQTLAEEQAASASAIISPPLEPTEFIQAPTIVQPTIATTNWWSSLAEWLAGRLGFGILGLLVAVFIILIWPLIRPNAARSMPGQPIGKINSSDETTQALRNLNRLASMNQSNISNQSSIHRIMTPQPFQPTQTQNKPSEQFPAQPPGMPQA